MISRMHALMAPGLTIVGALLFTDRVFAPLLPPPTREALRLAACVGMVSGWVGVLVYVRLGVGVWAVGSVRVLKHINPLSLVRRIPPNSN